MPLTGLRALVVDDDQDILTSLVTVLRQSGAVALEAHDGGQALMALLKDAPIHVVVLDLMLPGTNGWEFLDAKAKLEEGKFRVPVVVSSGYTELPLELPASQVVATFVKPFDPHDLVAFLERYLPNPES